MMRADKGRGFVQEDLDLPRNEEGMRGGPSAPEGGSPRERRMAGRGAGGNHTGIKQKGLQEDMRNIACFSGSMFQMNRCTIVLATGKMPLPKSRTSSNNAAVS